MRPGDVRFPGRPTSPNSRTRRRRDHRYHHRASETHSQVHAANGRPIGGFLTAGRSSRRRAPARRSPASPSGEDASPPSVAPTIGVELGPQRVQLALVSAAGEILSAHRHPVHPTDRPEALAKVIANCIGSCLGDSARRGDAVAVGIRAQIRPDGTVVASSDFPWHEVPLASLLRRATGLPTLVVSDGRAATLAEWRSGAGRGEHDLVCMFVGNGVGGGVVVRGQLWTGASGSAGEVGHLPIERDGRTCRCGGAGCLEAYVGGWAIAERAREAARKKPAAAGLLNELAGGVEKIGAATVAEAYRAGDPLAQAILEETVHYLAEGLVGLVNVYDPQMVILGGDVISRFPKVLPATEALVRQRALEPAAGAFRLTPARLGEDACVLGAASLAHSRREGTEDA